MKKSLEILIFANILSKILIIGEKMLLKFRVKNYKSFKELQDFSLIGGSTKLNNDRLKKEKDFSILKFSALFGANGAGKSNLVDAFFDMQKIILNGLPNYIKPIYFKLDDDCRKIPSYFEVYLLINNFTYCYGFEYDSINNKLTSEWLIKINGKKEINIFSREIDSETYSTSLKLDKKDKNMLIMYLEDLKNDTKLFLSFINLNKNSILLEKIEGLKEVYKWFNDSLNIIKEESILWIGNSGEIEKKIIDLSSLLALFDTGIKGVESQIINNETAYLNISSKIIEELKMNFFNDNYCGLVKVKNGLWEILFANNDFIFKKISFYHDKEKRYPFSLDEESEGTIRLINLADILLTENNDKLFIIDELDRKLHPQITLKFVELFLEKAKKSNNQLIVTTHESRLLDFDILRRDEIWFSAKEESGESKIYSLEEFNVRFDKKIDKAYLDGRYGGIPIFNEIFPFLK